ncbi:prolyl 3-hydroxylase /prolyl 3,4-dihydroxylase [Nematocida ausubeli]|nr:prolyl 3-hydroxylase /prolyl 3,4-dihydroxylase [Nematocida ausubeli]
MKQRENELGDIPKEKGAQFSAPFYHRVVDNFLPQDLFEKVHQEALSREYFKKNTDLFHFYQTYELKNDASFQPFLEFLKDKMDIDLCNIKKEVKEKRMDLFASIYKSGDFLLPHDDCVGQRVLAFSFYLNDPLASTSDEAGAEKKESTDPNEKNGALVLYESDGRTIAKRIAPIANRLVIFEVSGRSYHEVEMMTRGTRMALTGWLNSDGHLPESILLDYRPFRYWIFQDTDMTMIPQVTTSNLVSIDTAQDAEQIEEITGVLAGLQWKKRLNCVYTSLDEPEEDPSGEITILPLGLSFVKSDVIVDVLVGRINKGEYMLLNDPFNTDSDALIVQSLYDGPIVIVDEEGEIAGKITQPGYYVYYGKGSLFIPPHHTAGYIVAYRVKDIDYMDKDADEQAKLE